MVLHISFSKDSSPSLIYNRHFWFPDSDGQRIMDILDKYVSFEVQLDEKEHLQVLHDKQKKSK